jgi:hypothetical protein
MVGAIGGRTGEGIVGWKFDHGREYLTRHAFRDARYAENELPQPQVVLAFGLRIENCAPCRLSL